MPWIFFLLAAGCFIIVLNAQSALLLGLALLAMLGLMLAGVLSLASSRINSRSRSEAHILTPDELRALRNRAHRQGSADSGSGTTKPTADVGD